MIDQQGDSTSHRKPNSARRTLLRLGLAGGVMALVVGGFLWRQSPATEEQLLKLAGRAARGGDLHAAAMHLQEALRRAPDSAAVLEMSADVARQDGQFDAAIEFLSRIEDDASPASANARYLAAEILIRNLQRPASAEPLLRRAVQQDPGHLLARDRLCFVLGLAVRPWELMPQQLAALKLGSILPRRLYLLSLGERLSTDPKAVSSMIQASPEDLILRQGQAQIEAASQHRPAARKQLQSLVERIPECGDAQAQLGRLILEDGTDLEFELWSGRLSKSVEDHPGVWSLRGAYEQRHRRQEEAARCYWEALRRDPNHQQAAYQLGQLLVSLGRAAEGQPFLIRADRLERYVQAVNAQAWVDPQDPASAKTFQRLARLASELNLVWEAPAWQRLSEQASSPEHLEDNRPLAVAEGAPLVRTRPEDNPAGKIDLEGLSLPRRSDGLPQPPATDVSPTASVSFRDDAPMSGIDFRYFGDDDKSLPGQRIFETIGGGVAVLDFDNDDRPDLYFTQGCRWPPRSDRTEFLDKLFRQTGNGTFAEVSGLAGIREPGYSQGAAAGDFDNDGFTDLYVGNIGPNRFFRNNGDGTFSDVTAETATAAGGWTTSCLLADLNGDALPDLYTVTYVSGEDAFRMVCRNSDGNPRVCAPQMFAAAEDRVYLNLGDGRFEEQTAAAGISAPDGRGLGVLAADFDGSGRLSVFVANDQSANFLLINQSVPGGPLRFSEQGLARGAALDGQGRAQASMGIAADDANGDGLVDLFVTTFIEEPNTLFLQQPGLTFADATPRSGLGPPSLPWLGFGTQFIDAELDGWPDLIVANGHVSDQSAQGVSYEMPLQYFRNLGDARFEELTAKTLGPAFQRRSLGRGLARLDWNRDGLEDVVISNLESKAALLTNMTKDSGRGLTVSLKGTASSRDAIGTVVTLHVGSKTLVRQLTSGDGFHASNDRCLTFGLGASHEAVRLDVRWPSGTQQSYAGIASGQRLLLVEGRGAPVSLP